MRKRVEDEMSTETAQEAVGLFNSGYNCAESVLIALSQELGQKNAMIPRIATGFGAGIGRAGDVCGALSGAVMAMGLQGGCDKAAEEKDKRQALYRDVLSMVDDFEKEFGSSQCKILTGCNLRTKEGLDEYYRQETRKKICPKLVGWCADYVAKKLRV